MQTLARIKKVAVKDYCHVITMDEDKLSKLNTSIVINFFKPQGLHSYIYLSLKIPNGNFLEIHTIKHSMYINASSDTFHTLTLVHTFV